MKLSAPTNVVFIISVIVAIIGLIAALGVVTAISAYAVWIMLLAFIILAVGCMMTGV